MTSVRLLSVRLLIVSTCAFFATVVGAMAQDNHLGKDAFQRCAACHLLDGAGVPGAFPSLRENITTLAASDAGRDYLTYIVRKGVAGVIEVDGATYRGVMPAVAADLDDEAIAALLNYLVLQVAPGESDAPADANDFAPFVAAEIAERSKAVLDAHSQQGILLLRAKAIADNAEKPPQGTQ